MQSYSVNHGADPSCGKEPSANSPDILIKPRKTGVKRKPSDIDVSHEAKRLTTQTKKPCLGIDRSGHKDPLLSLKDELVWMTELECMPYMRQQAWPEGEWVWSGCDVSKQQRADVIDWLIVIHQGLKLEKDTLFVTVNLLDRFIQKGRVSNKALKPLALSCLWIASKLSDNHSNIPREWLLMKLLGSNHTLDEFHLCERMVLRAVGCHLWRPTALQFAEKYASVLKPDLVKSVRLKMQSALELCLRDYNMSYRHPSEVGIAALSYALGLETDTVGDTLLDVSGYDIHSLHGYVVHICNAAFHAYEMEEADPIFNKYPKAFAPQSNVYLRFRIMANKK